MEARVRHSSRLCSAKVQIVTYLHQVLRLTDGARRRVDLEPGREIDSLSPSLSDLRYTFGHSCPVLKPYLSHTLSILRRIIP